MYTKKMNLYGAIWAKCPSVAYLEGRLKSRSYGKCILLFAMMSLHKS